MDLAAPALGAGALWVPKRNIEPLPLARRAAALLRPTVAKQKEQGDVAAVRVVEVLLKTEAARPAFANA